MIDWKRALTAVILSRTVLYTVENIDLLQSRTWATAAVADFLLLGGEAQRRRLESKFSQGPAVGALSISSQPVRALIDRALGLVGFLAIPSTQPMPMLPSPIEFV